MPRPKRNNCLSANRSQLSDRRLLSRPMGRHHRPIQHSQLLRLRWLLGLRFQIYCLRFAIPFLFLKRSNSNHQSYKFINSSYEFLTKCAYWFCVWSWYKCWSKIICMCKWCLLGASWKYWKSDDWWSQFILSWREWCEILVGGCWSLGS